MNKRLSLAAAALGLVAVVASPSAALADEIANLDTATSQGITWVGATVSAGDHDGVSIKIFHVSGTKRNLWQRCNFNFSGTGTYRCGLDSATGSLAHEQGGRWVAKAFVDGHLVARHSFSL